MGRQTDRFVAFVDAERMPLLATAYLVGGDAASAVTRVDAVLASSFARWSSPTDPRITAYVDLLAPWRGTVSLAPWRGTVSLAPWRGTVSLAPWRGTVSLAPWRGTVGLELIDTVADIPAAPAPEPPLVVADLTLLCNEQRRVLVLATVAGLSAAQIATVTGESVERIDELRRSAIEVLARRDPNRHEESVLRAELTTAARHAFTADQLAGEDLAHVRVLSRRRTRSRLAAVAVLVVMVLAITQLLSDRRAPAAAPTPAPTATSAAPIAPGCAVEDTACRVTLTRAWRSQIWTVARSYVDPERQYFTGYGYGDESTYDDDDLWAGKGGALGLDLLKSKNGSTKILVQVASAREFAPRCGLTTQQHCVRMRFMNGNWVTLTETTSVTEGIEVQFSPDGVQVVTVIAQNVSRGEAMKINRGDLISLAEDDRLRLPQT